MKATGIIRRIDDLGRVVIPKEIRRSLNIREGDPLEIFTDRDGSVIFKKYSPSHLVDISQDIVSALWALGIKATVYDDCGNPLDPTNPKGINVEDELLEPFLFEIREENDLWGYVRIHGAILTELQRAQIEGVIAMALVNL